MYLREGAREGPEGGMAAASSCPRRKHAPRQYSSTRRGAQPPRTGAPVVLVVQVFVVVVFQDGGGCHSLRQTAAERGGGGSHMSAGQRTKNSWLHVLGFWFPARSCSPHASARRAPQAVPPPARLHKALHRGALQEIGLARQRVLRGDAPIDFGVHRARLRLRKVVLLRGGGRKEGAGQRRGQGGHSAGVGAAAEPGKQLRGGRGRSGGAGQAVGGSCSVRVMTLESRRQG